MNAYRLPNDKHTTSQDVYLRAWGKIERQLNKKLNGAYVIAYDPGFTIINEDEQTVNVPMWLALKII